MENENINYLIEQALNAKSLKKAEVLKLVDLILQQTNPQEYLMKSKGDTYSDCLMYKLAKKWNYLIKNEKLANIVYSDKELLKVAIYSSPEKILYYAPENINELNLDRWLSTMIEYTNVITIKNFHAFCIFENIINIFMDHDRTFIQKNLDRILLSTTKDKLVLDKLIETGQIKDITSNEKNNIYLSIKNELLAKELYKRKEFGLLAYVDSNTAFKTIEGKTIIEILYENKISPKHINIFSEYYTRAYKKTIPNFLEVQKKVAKILIKNNQYDELACDLRECDILFEKVDEEKRVIDYIYDKYTQIDFIKIDNVEYAKYIVENKLTKFYKTIDVNILTSNYNLNETYLDIILDEINEEELAKIVKHISHDLTPKLYIIFAEHNLEKYLPILTKEILLKNDFLEQLMKESLYLTMTKILHKKVRQDIDIAIRLKLYNIDQDEIMFKSVTKDIKEEIISEIIDEYESLEISKEQEDLLKELEYLLTTNKFNDKEIIQVAISSYRYLFHTNNPHAKEIYSLIQMLKKDNTKISIVYNPNLTFSYYSNLDQLLSMEEKNVETFNHEIGHAMFFELADGEVPSEFERLINELREDPKFIDKTLEYSNCNIDLIEKLSQAVEQEYMSLYDSSITNEVIKKVEEEIDDIIKNQTDKYLKEGYSKETLDLIFQRTFTTQQYLIQDRRIKKQEIISLIMRAKCATFMSLGDFLDGIHRGKLHDAELKDNDGDIINPTSGHGIYYYSQGGVKVIFNEMIANYSAIAKSKDAKEGLMALKYYIGDELFNLIQKYYYEKIINNKKYEESFSL